MKFSSFIRSHLDAIVAEWETFAKTIPAGEEMSGHSLRDHCREILLAAADDMDTAETAEQQAGRARRLPDDHAAEQTLRTPAALHGSLRELSGFELSHMVAEFRALRASVLALWRDSGVEKPIKEAVEEISRFNEAIDQAIADSVQSYSANVGESRDLFLATLGHDLRGPLSVIDMSRAILERAELAPEPRAAATLRIRRSVRSMSGLISDLMGYTRSRLGAGIPISPSRCDLRQLCEDALDSARAHDPGRKFVGHLPRDLVVDADPARMEQVLTNLLFNAAQHGSKDAPVVLDLRLDGDEVVLSVANQGTLIQEGALRTIFEPFVRGSDSPEHSSGERSKTSLGLGLFIVREIVRGHHGEVSVQSTEEAGTVFTIRLSRVSRPPGNTLKDDGSSGAERDVESR